MATLNTNIFSDNFRNLSNFPEIIQLIESSPTLTRQLNQLPIESIGKSGTNETSATGKNIVIGDDVIANGPGEIAIALAHEVAHAVLEGGIA